MPLFRNVASLARNSLRYSSSVPSISSSWSLRSFSSRSTQLKNEPTYTEEELEYDYPFFFGNYLSEFEYEDDLFDFLTEEDLAYLESEHERNFH